MNRTPAPHPAQSQRILVVDDDVAIRRLLKQRLEESGFQVMLAESGEDALELIARVGLPHLAVVDLNMPGMSGFDFVKRVQDYSDLPVIILTATSEEDTVVQGLTDFAEDYMTKPFHPRELIARVHRVLRRIGDFSYTLEAETRVDERLAVDFAHQRARVDGKPVSLTPTETKLLYMLMRNAGRTVPNELLLKRLRSEQEVFEDTLRVHIHRLRAKVEPPGTRGEYIMTERGIGYRFVKPSR